MRKLKAIILLLIAFATQVVAQSTVHLCAGTNHNFGVPYTVGSSYNWQVQANNAIATITSGNGTEHIIMDLNNSGVFQLLVEEIDVNGCSGYDSILVEIHALPNPNIFALGPISFCEGDSVLLQVDSAYVTQNWNNGTTSIYTYADTSGNYFVNVTDANGCSNRSNTINIDVRPSPVANFIVDGICANTPSQFVNTSTISMGNIANSIWYLGNGELVNGDSLLYTYTYAGDYFTQLFVTSDYGCLDSIGKWYSIYNPPFASFEYNPFSVSTLQPEMNFVTTTSNFISVFWDFDDSTYSILSNPLHEFEDPGIYDVMLMVSDSNQCVDSVIHRITMYYDFVLFIPNTFTPDKDGINDKFGPKGIRMEKYESYEFTVFNRWGEKVFTTDKVSEQWDGVNGLLGTYTWSIIIIDELGAVRKKVGEVMLIK
ncbi:PKD domain-containing protein [Flavobacteriales bacterium]|nr:PKD domain-containing protein [Flavobacteriales bacterium]